MDSWLMDQFHALHNGYSDSAIFKTIVSFAYELGFEYCAYGARMPLPLSKPKVTIFNNYPDAWQNRYRQQNYLCIDPTVRQCYRSSLPIVWSDGLFDQAREFWEDARSHNLRFGWAYSSREPNGLASMLTLARSAEALSEPELREKSVKMKWLTEIAHTRMSRLLGAGPLPNDQAELSSREAEVLRWTGDGKTSTEISEILSISERTVNFHINNAMAKLNVPNKTAATVKAAMLGLLYFN